MGASRVESEPSGVAQARRDTAATTARQRRENERAAKLAALQELIASGDLIVRPMTRSERRRWAARRKTADLK